MFLHLDNKLIKKKGWVITRRVGLHDRERGVSEQVKAILRIKSL